MIGVMVLRCIELIRMVTVNYWKGSCSFYIEHIESLDGGKAWIESIPAELVNKARVYADLGVYMLKIAAMSNKARQLLSQRPMLLYLVCERLSH